MNGATFNLYRKTMGYTTTQIAQKLQVNRRTIQRWENETTSIPKKYAQEITLLYTKWIKNLSARAKQAALPHSMDPQASALNQAALIARTLKEQKTVAKWEA